MTKTIDEYYKDYLKEVELYKAKGGGVGWTGPMVEKPPMTLLQFKMSVAAEKNSAKFLGKHYMGTTRFAHKMASETVNELSYKQALKAREVATALGVKVSSLQEYRYAGWSPELQDAISKERQKLKQLHPEYDAGKLNHLFSQMYFGSL